MSHSRPSPCPGMVCRLSSRLARALHPTGQCTGKVREVDRCLCVALPGGAIHAPNPLNVIRVDRALSWWCDLLSRNWRGPIGRFL